MKKFFKKLYETHNSVDSIEDLRRDGEDELDLQTLAQRRLHSEPQTQSQPDPQPETDEPVPSMSRTSVAIRMNPLGRPFSNIYKSIDSTQYDTYSEESKDSELLTDERSRDSNLKTSRENNNGDDINMRLRRDPELELLSIEDQQLSENCIIKCFCMKRRKYISKKRKEAQMLSKQ